MAAQKKFVSFEDYFADADELALGGAEVKDYTFVDSSLPADGIAGFAVRSCLNGTHPNVNLMAYLGAFNPRILNNPYIGLYLTLEQAYKLVEVLQAEIAKAEMLAQDE
jgi:hypothetical protein